jgi:hypothetical protein
MKNHLRPRVRQRLSRRSIRRLAKDSASEGEQRRPNKPSRSAVEPGVFHMPATAQPREGNIRYLNPESVERRKPHASRRKKRLVTRADCSPELLLTPPFTGA